jgi:hypothetical protein
VELRVVYFRGNTWAQFGNEWQRDAAMVRTGVIEAQSGAENAGVDSTLGMSVVGGIPGGKYDGEGLS